MNRHSLLPAFPSLHEHGVVIYNQHNHLLLANIPRNQLTQEQRQQREHDYFPRPFTLIDHRNQTNLLPSFYLQLHGQFYNDLIRRLHVDETILDYNYQRLFKCMDIMINERIQHGFATSPITHYEQLPINEYAIALEFYLQIDVDCFYMKTCTFRGAQPRLTNEGLFCINEPQARYGMIACQQKSCQFCFPSIQIKKNRHLKENQYEPVVQFSTAQKHRFIHGYEIILNCPTSCLTKNIIYTLTCPCKQFDYIGYTSMTLSERLFYHRQHGNRILREFILGSKNIERLDSNIKTQEDLMKDGMLLYRHSARCTIAMQWFLNCNPLFWSFIPMKKQQAELDNQSYVLPTSIPVDPISPLITNNSERSDLEAGLCLIDLPVLPSNNYTFSTRQCAEQFQLFKKKQNYLLPNNDLDLYNAKIIVVLPTDCSTPFKRLIEALLITHTQTNLNTIGHLDCIVQKINSNNSTHERIILDRGDWCQNLIRP